MKHYLIFYGGRGGHSVVHLLKASTPLDAICRFIQKEDSRVCREDGTIQDVQGRKTTTYTHPLEYIESSYKNAIEWDIRELPDQAWDVQYAGELFCGEEEASICACIEGCRAYLRRDYPRSRARGFVWYLRDEENDPRPLVTFYQKKPATPIRVLRRYLITGWVTPTQPAAEEWSGSYNDLLNCLWLKWWKSEDQIEKYLKSLNSEGSLPGTS